MHFMVAIRIYRNHMMLAGAFKITANGYNVFTIHYI